MRTLRLAGLIALGLLLAGGVIDLVATIHKEKLEDFERAFHRRSCLSKLSLCEGILDTATACYDDALKNSSTPKSSLESCRARREAHARLKAKLVEYREALKVKEDGKSAKALIETYGVQVDPDLHREVLERYAKLNLAPYSGFLNPVYTPILANGAVVDVKIDLTEGYIEQMLRYGREYAFLK